ncbi:Uncharacterised protein [Lactobacillus paragasseri]|nr:Uncharacterised protein [Lactobacillus paragasseri]
MSLTVNLYYTGKMEVPASLLKKWKVAVWLIVLDKSQAMKNTIISFL